MPIITLQQFEALAAKSGILITYTSPIMVSRCLAGPLLYHDIMNAEISVLSTQQSFGLFFSDWGNYLVALKGNDYALDLSFYSNPAFLKGFEPPILHWPRIQIGAIDFSNYLKDFLQIRTLEVLKILSEESSVPIPISLIKHGQPAAQCLFNGKLLPSQACYSPELVTKAAGMDVTTDTDQDGVKDIVELSIPYVDGALLLQVVLDAAAKPATVVKGSGYGSVMYLDVPYPLSPNELMFWEMGKARAVELIEPVYTSVLATLGADDDVQLLLYDPAMWKTVIDLMKPAHLWGLGNTASEEFLAYPIAITKKLLGVNGCASYGIMSLSAEATLAGLANGTCGIYVDLWQSIAAVGPGNESIINDIADTILHELLHSHIVMANNNEIEHAVIYLLSREYLDFGCGTQ